MLSGLTWGSYHGTVDMLAHSCKTNDHWICFDQVLNNKEFPPLFLTRIGATWCVGGAHAHPTKQSNSFHCIYFYSQLHFSPTRHDYINIKKLNKIHEAQRFTFFFFQKIYLLRDVKYN